MRLRLRPRRGRSRRRRAPGHRLRGDPRGLVLPGLRRCASRTSSPIRSSARHRGRRAGPASPVAASCGQGRCPRTRPPGTTRPSTAAPGTPLSSALSRRRRRRPLRREPEAAAIRARGTIAARAMSVAPAMSERTLRASSAASPSDQPSASPSPVIVTLTLEKSARCFSWASSERTAARVARAGASSALISAISSGESASASWASSASTSALASSKRSSALTKGAVMSRVPSLREATPARSERSARKAWRFWVGMRRSKVARARSPEVLTFDSADDAVVALGHLDHAVGDLGDLVGVGRERGRDGLLLDALLAGLELLAGAGERAAGGRGDRGASPCTPGSIASSAADSSRAAPPEAPPCGAPSRRSTVTWPALVGRQRPRRRRAS